MILMSRYTLYIQLQPQILSEKMGFFSKKKSEKENQEGRNDLPEFFQREA